MVSIAQTSLKYRKKKADTYDTIRTKQARWDFENNVIDEWLRAHKPRTILDVPVGTGRFIKLYAEISARIVTGMDISDRMIELAKLKVPRKMKAYGQPELVVGNVLDLAAPKWGQYDMSVCVRFLDLIDEEAMRKVVTKLAAVTKKHIVLTIRLGENYVAKSNTAEHDRNAFKRLIKRLGFKIEKSAQFREGSWHVLLLART